MHVVEMTDKRESPPHLRLPRQIVKGLTTAINADPMSKGASPFGVGGNNHRDESVTAAGRNAVVDNNNPEGAESKEGSSKWRYQRAMKSIGTMQ